MTVSVRKINWYLLMLTPQKIQPAFAKPRLSYSSLGRGCHQIIEELVLLLSGHAWLCLKLVLIELCSAQHTGNDKVPLRRLTGEVDERFKHTLREMSCTCSDLPALVILHTDPTCTEQLKSALFALGHLLL